VTASVLFRDAEVEGTIVDVRCDAMTITDVGVRGTVSGADTVVDAGGGALLPGLHDHHVHLFALAAARASLDLSRVEDPAAFDAAVRRAVTGPPADEWLRVVGYHQTVHGPLDRERLDALAPGRRVRVQHRTGAMWTLSSTGLEAARVDSLDHPGVERGADGALTGRLFGLDEVLRDRVDTVVPDLAAAARELAGYGVTGVTDLTPMQDAATADLLAATALEPSFPLRVVITGGPDLPADAGEGLARGPVKLVVADHDLPSVEALIAGIEQARSAGRTVAMHCVTRVGLALALAAWDEAGSMPGDRVEHGAVIPADAIDRLRKLGLVVVTQPSFVADRGDEYLRDVEPDDMPHLWRCGSLLAAGVGVGIGTDAPHGPANPWLAVAAACERRTRSGVMLGGAERIEARRALAMFSTPPDDPAGRPRRMRVGEPSDLCLLAQPLDATLDDPAAPTVAATHGRAGLVMAED
jgi:predicted amidohydrolase YtcJ